MEAHVFCGPEFLLAIPDDRLADMLTHSHDDVEDSETTRETPLTFHGPLREAVLQTFQTDIFNVLTPHLRRRLHHGYAQIAPSATSSTGATLPAETFDRLDRQQRQKRMTSSSLALPRHQGAIPPPPASLRFLEPLLRYPTAFKTRLTKVDSDTATTAAATTTSEETDAPEQAASAPTTPSAPATLASVLTHAPALAAATGEEEELLLNSVRVLTSQRPSASSSTKAGPQSSTAALSAALAASAAPSAADASGRPAVHFFLLYLCDARVAAELHMLCLANFHISLSYGAKMYTVFARTAKAAPIVLDEVLAKREVLRAHANMDGDMHEILSARLTDAFVDGVLQARANSRGGAGLLTSEERHQQHIEAIVQYCEEKVQYAGVLDNDGEASPFLLAMGLVLRLELTPQDLLHHFIPHPRRILRAVALFLARYLFPPEDLAPFFAASVEDAVVIACTEDQSLTASLQDLSRQLLEKDEVNEAWLPGAAPWKRYWLPRVVAPMALDMQRYVIEQKQDRERRLAAATSAHADRDDTARTGGRLGDGERRTGPTGSTSATDGGDDALMASGRGVSALGFRKLTDLVAFAKTSARNVAHETLRRRLGQHWSPEAGAASSAGSRKRRRPDGATADGDDWELVMQERDDDDDMLIHVEVEAGDEDGDGLDGGLHRQSHAVAPNGLVGGGEASSMTMSLRRHDDTAHGKASASPAQRQRERLTARQTAMKEGYALVLSLLGRAHPFQRDERYLQF